MLDSGFLMNSVLQVEAGQGGFRAVAKAERKVGCIYTTVIVSRVPRRPWTEAPQGVVRVAEYLYF